MKKLSLILSISLFVCQSLKAQFPTSEELLLKDGENIKKNILVVILLSEDEKYLKNLTKKKPEEVNTYKNQIQNYNTNIQLLAPQMIHISKGIQFKSLTEIAQMTYEDRANCTFMLLGYCSPAFNDWSEMPRIDFHCKAGPKKGIESFYDIESLFDTKLKYYLRWEFYNVNEKGKSSQLVFYKNLPNIFVSKSDIAYGLNQTQLKFECVFSKKNNEFNSQILKEKTLLINKDNLDEKTTEAGIKANYQYKFEIVTQEEFDKAILDRKSVV